MVMPKLNAVPAPLATLPTAAPMALPQMGFAFPHGAAFGINNGVVQAPKGAYVNVAEPKNVNPYSPSTQYDAYANAVKSYKYYQNSPYVGLHPSQVPVTHVKHGAYGVLPAPLYPGKIWAKGGADGKVQYFNSDPSSTEAVHSWPAYGKHSQAQTNQILQTRYLAENQKVGTLAVNGLAHAVSANIAQNQAHNKMQAKALEQILKETEEQKSAVSEALAQVEKTIKPASEAVAEDAEASDDGSGSGSGSDAEEKKDDKSEEASDDGSGSGSDDDKDDDKKSDDSSGSGSGSGSDDDKAEEKKDDDKSEDA